MVAPPIVLENNQGVYTFLLHLIPGWRQAKLGFTTLFVNLFSRL